MKRFSEILNERYINLIDNDEEKVYYIDVVWDLIQRSYAPIGGIQGNGFKSKEDMIKNIPFWKLLKKDGKVIAVFLYKEKGGRKRVATGTDGSQTAKDMLSDFYKKEFSRSYSEVSGASWGTIKRNFPEDELLAMVKTVDEVKQIVGKKDKIIPLKDFDHTLDKDFRFKSTDKFLPYYYARQIGNEFHVKIMLGVDKQYIK
jgi:hypothetical protein